MMRGKKRLADRSGWETSWQRPLIQRKAPFFSGEPLIEAFQEPNQRFDFRRTRFF